MLITGGTGTLGRLVVSRLRDAGCAVRVLSRRQREATHGIEYITGDLDSVKGIEPAVDGVGTIVHCAGGPTGDDRRTLNLLRAASRSGTPHLVYISVVGANRIPVVSRIDRAMFGYYASKHAAEKVVANGGLPYTMLRSTQFHELILKVSQQLVKLPVALIPAGFRFQPIAADEVAARLTQLALEEPAGMVTEMGGPRVHDAADLLRGYMRAVGVRRPIVPVPLPGKAAQSLRAGVHLTPEQAVGTQTWEEFLAERVGG